MNDFESEIETLRAALRAARLKDGVYLPLEQFTDMQERLSGQAVQLTELEDILKARNSSCKELEEVAEKNASEVAALVYAKQEVSEKLAATQVELTETKQTLAKVSDELQRVQVVLKAFQNNEQVLLANGLTAAELYDARQKQTAQLLTKIGTLISCYTHSACRLTYLLFIFLQRVHSVTTRPTRNWQRRIVVPRSSKSPAFWNDWRHTRRARKRCLLTSPALCTSYRRLNHRTCMDLSQV